MQAGCMQSLLCGLQVLALQRRKKQPPAVASDERPQTSEAQLSFLPQQHPQQLQQQWRQQRQLLKVSYSSGGAPGRLSRQRLAPLCPLWCLEHPFVLLVRQRRMHACMHCSFDADVFQGNSSPC